jgi:hypothetical protein
MIVSRCASKPSPPRSRIRGVVYSLIRLAAATDPGATPYRDPGAPPGSALRGR